MSITTKLLGCNIDCIYCNQQGFQGPQPKIEYSVDKMLETIREIDRVEGSGNGDNKGGGICMHGGEPTLMRIEDMERFLSEIRKTDPKRDISIQTNGYALNDAHISLFKKYRVSVGISLDGPEKLNSGRGFYDEHAVRKEEYSDKYTEKVEKNVIKLLEAQVSVGFICVLNKFNSATPQLRNILKAWLLDWFSKGVNSARLNLGYIDNPCSQSWVELSETEMVDAHVDYCEWALDHPEICVLPFRSFVDNLLGNSLEECRFAACDPYRTSGENVALPMGGRGNCWRLVGEAGDGVFWTRDTHTNDVRQHVLYSVPKEEGGCGGCRYWRVCYGGCPAEGVDADWRNRSRFCKAYYATYAVVEKRLKNLLPNIMLVSDFKEDLLDYADNRKRSNGQWKRIPFESMLSSLTKQPSSFSQRARKIRGNRPTLRIFDVSSSELRNGPITGIHTYRHDFMRVIEPELRNYFEFATHNAPADKVLSLYQFIPLNLRGDSAFVVAHKNYKFDDWVTRQGQGEEGRKWVFEGQTFIAHTMGTKSNVETYSGKAIYIPMGVDTKVLPQNKNKNGKWVYFGNVTNTDDTKKLELLEELKKYIPIDIIERVPHDKALNIISEYSYGIGVGRAALEMLGMGLRVIIAGSEYGGPILNADIFKKHHLANCNGTFNESMGYKEDIQNLIDSKDANIDVSLFDIRNTLLPHYLNLLGVTL